MEMQKQIPKIEVSFHPSRQGESRLYVKESKEVASVFLECWNLDTIELYEEFKVLYLDRKNGIIGIRDLNRGTQDGVIVDIKLLVSVGLLCNCSSVIVAHNHPSGALTPSNNDLELTKKLEKALRLFDLNLIDHVILTKNSYLSFADEGKI